VNPQNTVALESLALYYAKKGDVKRGMEFIQRARAIDKKDVTLLYVQAVVQCYGNQQADAIKTMREAFQNGYPVTATLSDPDLAILQNNPEFIALKKQFEKAPQAK